MSERRGVPTLTVTLGAVSGVGGGDTFFHFRRGCDFGGSTRKDVRIHPYDASDVDFDDSGNITKLHVVPADELPGAVRLGFLVTLENLMTTRRDLGWGGGGTSASVYDFFVFIAIITVSRFFFPSPSRPVRRQLLSGDFKCPFCQ